MSSKFYSVDNEEWHGKVEMVRRAVAKGFGSYIPPYNGLEKRAAHHFRIYRRLKAIHCRPPAFPKVVTDSNLGQWFRATKKMIRRATGPRAVAIESALNGRRIASRRREGRSAKQ